MGILTILVTAIHAGTSLVNFRLGFYTFIFLYVTYPRLFAIGIGGEGFALTAQRIMLLTMAVLFFLKILYGSADTQNAIRIFRDERTIAISFAGLLLGRLIGNITTGRIDLTVVTGFADEFLNTLFIVLVICCCLTKRTHVHKLWVIFAASVIVNELVTCIEFFIQGSIYPDSLNLDFETARSSEKMIEGGSRYGSYRVMGLFDSTLKLMALGCLALPIFWHLAKNARLPNERIIFYSALAFLPLMILMTGSRTGMIVMVFVILCYLTPIIINSFSGIMRVVIISTISLLIIAVLYASLDSLLNSFLFGSGTGKSTASRVFQYVYGWELLLQSPIFGYGYARNIVDVIEIQTIDSYYLRVLMEGGAVALVSLLALFRSTFLLLGRVKLNADNESDKQLAAGLQITLAVLAVTMLVINMGTISLYVFVICGSAIVLNRSISDPAHGKSENIKNLT
jgi:hypothetical protein